MSERLWNNEPWADLAYDLHGDDPMGGPTWECGCDLAAKRLFALGWRTRTRIEFTPEQLRNGIRPPNADEEAAIRRAWPEVTDDEIRPELLVWFHKSEGICDHNGATDDRFWPCGIMADALRRSFAVSPRLTTRTDGTSSYEGRHFYRLVEYARLHGDDDEH